MSLLRRALDVTFQLATGTFADTGTNALTLKGLRVTAKIVNAGGATKGEIDLAVYGMTPTLMNQLSTLGILVNKNPLNQVLVGAGDSSSTARTTVFVGNIRDCWIDFAGAPEVPLRVRGYSLGAMAAISTKPQSFSGSTDVASIMSGLATQMSVPFENNGVVQKLSGQYLYGSPYDQAAKVVRITGIGWNGANDGTLAIWPQGGARPPRGGTVPVIQPPEMRGYPTFTQNGVEVQTVFNPNISFGAMVQIKSSIPAASQLVRVGGLDHDLAAEVHEGPWFSTVRGYNPDLPLGTVLPP